jgi:hypothetical protein
VLEIEKVAKASKTMREAQVLMEEYPLILVPPNDLVGVYEDGSVAILHTALMASSPSFLETIMVFCSLEWGHLWYHHRDLFYPVVLTAISHESIHQALHHMGKVRTSARFDWWSGNLRDMNDMSGVVTEEAAQRNFRRLKRRKRRRNT